MPELESAVITVTVGSNSAEESLIVLPADSLSLSAPDEVTVRAGSPARFLVRADGPGAAALAVTAAGLPDSATYDSSTGAFEWLPGNQDLGSRKITFSAPRPGGEPVGKTVTVNVETGLPVIRSVRNGASRNTVEACSPGSVASLWGHFLASGDEQVDPSGSTISLGGTRVLVNGVYAKILSSASNRVDFLCPMALVSTRLQIQVETSSGVSKPAYTVMRESAPGIFSVDSTESGQAWAVAANTGELAAVANHRYTGNPVLPGDTLEILATGIDCSDAAAQPLLEMAGDRAKIVSVKPSANAGVCAIEAIVPAGISGDEVPVTLQTVRGDGRLVRSNTASISVDMRR